jgi:hypothetical protein
LPADRPVIGTHRGQPPGDAWHPPRPTPTRRGVHEAIPSPVPAATARVELMIGAGTDSPGSLQMQSSLTEPQGAMLCYALKIPVARQHQQAVADTQLRQERIDRANLNAMTTAGVTKRRGIDVIGSIGHEEGKCGEPIQNLLTRFWSREACSSSCSTRPVVRIGSPFSIALTRTVTCGADEGPPRRSARDQTLVSTKRLNFVSAPTCSHNSDPTRVCP